MKQSIKEVVSFMNSYRQIFKISIVNEDHIEILMTDYKIDKKQFESVEELTDWCRRNLPITEGAIEYNPQKTKELNELEFSDLLALKELLNQKIELLEEKGESIDLAFSKHNRQVVQQFIDKKINGYFGGC